MIFLSLEGRSTLFGNLWMDIDTIGSSMGTLMVIVWGGLYIFFPIFFFNKHYKKFAYLRQHQVDAKSPKVDANEY
jgi:hypothetical protein